MIYNPVVTLILATLKKNIRQRVYLLKKLNSYFIYLVKLLRKWALKNTSPNKKTEQHQRRAYKGKESLTFSFWQITFEKFYLSIALQT